MFHRVTKRRARIGLFAVLLCSGTAIAATYTMSSYQTALIPIEGGPAGFNAVGSGGNYLGAFQLSTPALEDAGYKNADGSWTALAQSQGVDSNASFLANPTAQIAADNAYNAKNASYLGSTYTSDLNTVDPYSGVTLTSGALTYCAESLGAGGCQSYLNTGVIPAKDLAANPTWNNGGWQNNLRTMSATSTGDSGTVDVNTTSSSSPGGSTTTTTVAGIFCDPAIMNQLVTDGATMADNWTTLASRPETGYTLLGGQSVLEAAGLLTQGQPGYVGNSGLFGSLGGTYAQASCLSRLTNSGLNILFAPPNIGDILNQIEQAACNEAMQLFSQITQPISQSVYQTFSLQGAVPGLNLGTLGGVSMGSGNGLINVNGGSAGSASYSPSTGWYSGAASSGVPATSYGSLFGSATGSEADLGNLYGAGAP